MLMNWLKPMNWSKPAMKYGEEASHCPETEDETMNYWILFGIAAAVLLAMLTIISVFSAYVKKWDRKGHAQKVKVATKRTVKTDVEAQVWDVEKRRFDPNSFRGASEATCSYGDFDSAPIDTRMPSEEACWCAGLDCDCCDRLCYMGATEQPPAYQCEVLTSNVEDLPEFVRYLASTYSRDM